MASNEEIDQFVAITQGSKQDAERFLGGGTDLQSAIENYYAARGAEADPSESDSLLPDANTAGTFAQSDSAIGAPVVPADGPRTLDGRIAEAMPEGWGKPQPKAKAAPKTGGIATLFNTGIHPSATQGRGGDDDDDDEDEPQEFYAGGEKSGLAVQDPNQNKKKGPRGIVSDILSQAAKNTPHDDPEAAGPSGSSFFRGSGNVLGSEEGPSESASSSQPAAGGPRATAANPSAFDALLGSMFGRAPPPPAEEEETQVRHLTFWRNGFSIEDGPLMSYDDPANKELLEAIHSGRAPPSLFGVRYNQPLQVLVDQKTNEDYVKPKAVMRAFGGSGNRLGSPAPEAAGSGASTPSNMPGGFGAGATTSSGPSGGASQSGPQQAAFELDESKPATSIQVRLGDGTKMVAKVNLTHTVGDLRNFVSAARPDARSFVLQTTFPSKELKDDSETIEAAKLQNAVVVQRFT